MEEFSDILNFIFNNFIRVLFISILLIAFVRHYLKKVDTQTAITIIKWLLIVYSTGIVINFLLALIITNDSKDSVFWKRITGPYWFAYWIMLFGSISPFLLLIRKLGSKIYFIAFLAILMNIGWLFEVIIIRITSTQRDYINSNLPWDAEMLIVLQGMLLGIAYLILGNLVYQVRNKNRLAVK